MGLRQGAAVRQASQLTFCTPMPRRFSSGIAPERQARREMNATSMPPAAASTVAGGEEHDGFAHAKMIGILELVATAVPFDFGPAGLRSGRTVR